MKTEISHTIRDIKSPSERVLLSHASAKDTTSAILVSFTDVEPSKSVQSLCQEKWAELILALQCEGEVSLGLRNAKGIALEVKQFDKPQKFNILLKLVVIVTLHLERGTSTTVRDLYYKDKDLFGTQDNCRENLLLLFHHSLRLSLEGDLGIHASQKGIMYGGGPSGYSLVIKSKFSSSQSGFASPQADSQGLNEKLQQSLETTTIDFSYKDNPSLIPRFENLILGSGSKNVDVLLSEKEAGFMSLCDTVRNSGSPKQNFMFVTAKGFPDFLTRRFLKSLWKLSRHIRFRIIVDSDIYGHNIFRKYAEYIPTLEYVGVLLLSYKSGWLNISRRDRRMTVNSLTKLVKGKEQNHRTEEVYAGNQTQFGDGFTRDGGSLENTLVVPQIAVRKREGSASISTYGRRTKVLKTSSSDVPSSPPKSMRCFE